MKEVRFTIATPDRPPSQKRKSALMLVCVGLGKIGVDLHLFPILCGMARPTDEIRGVTESSIHWRQYDRHHR